MVQTFFQKLVFFFVKVAAKIYSKIPFVSKNKDVFSFIKKEPVCNEDRLVCFVFDGYENTISAYLPALWWMREKKGYKMRHHQNVWVTPLSMPPHNPMAIEHQYLNIGA